MPLSQSEMNAIRTRWLWLTQERATGCISGHLVADNMRVNAMESADPAGSQTFQQQPGCRFQLCDVVKSLWAICGSRLLPQGGAGYLPITFTTAVDPGYFSP